jgi:hypothetical protein
MCTSVARGVPLSLAVRCRTRVAVAARRQLFQTDVSRQSTLATAMRGMQPADGTTATGDKCDRDRDVGRHRTAAICEQAVLHRQRRHAPARVGRVWRRQRTACKETRASRGSRGSRWRWMEMGADAKRRKGRRSVWWAGRQHGSMAAWQDSRIEGGTAPEGERIKRRGGSKASKRDWTWYLGGRRGESALCRVGAWEAWRHRGMGTWGA